jgi:hypothetical protein
VLSPELVGLVLKSSRLAVMFVNFRSLLILVIVLQPLLAGYGIWALARLILVPEEALGREPRPRWARYRVRHALTGAFALALALAAILLVGRLAASDPWRRSYGPMTLDLRDVWGLALDDSCDLPSSAPGRPPLCNSLEARSALHLEEFGQACDLMEARGETLPSLCSSADATAAEVASFLQECDASSDSSAACQARVRSLAQQLLEGPWPALQLSDQDPGIQASRDLISELPPGRPLRMDVSPNLGRFAQDLAFYADASQVNSYTYQINLIHEMWGDQQNVFYSREEGVDERGTPGYLNDLAWWYGISTVLLHADLDPLETYAAAGWNLRSQVGDAEVWEWGGAPPMATLTSRPVVLVIGTPVNDSYMTVFRLAGGGMLPIDEALLVEGRPRIDDYTPEELRLFDGIILYGYDYSNGDDAWQTIETYVAGGGAVFLDTGWEYAIPEWEFDPTPVFFPIARASWTDYGLPAEFALGDPSIGGDVDVGLFKPLEWEGGPWSVSGAEVSDLRPGATTVLSAAGRPLVVAWRYGQGRVVWSGMNLMAHALYRGENDEEIQFLHNLLSWLLEGHEGDDAPAPSVLREDPDRVDALLSPTPSRSDWLLWREAYYPSWRAEVTDAAGTRTAPIYRAGPGLMLIPIDTDSPSALLALTWEASWVERLAAFASVAGLGLLGALVMDGLLLGGEGFTRLRIAIQTQSPRPFLGEGAGVDWMEERKKEIAERRAARHRRAAPDQAQGPKTEADKRAARNERDLGREPGGRPPEGRPR